MTTTKLSRFLLFLRAYYVQKVYTQLPPTINYIQILAQRIFGRIVKILCLGVNFTEAEEKEFCVVYAMKFSSESLDF